MSVCNNCGTSIESCTCGGTEGYSDDGAICPYCGYLNTASDSEGFLFDEGIDEYDCRMCEETFIVGAYVVWSWTTTKK